MKIYLVGGAVRDMLLGLPIKERDYVVVGATVEEMLRLGFRQVGKEFPVFLHPHTNEEYALARAERKVKPGYRGFTFDTAETVTLKDDLRRRDLTINAIAYDEQTQTFIDPFNGREDIEKRILRHVSQAFSEDPVRILRIGRLLARFHHLGFHIHKDTMQLMQAMVAAGEVDALVAERVWKELERALAEPNPELFFATLEKSHALAILFPGLTQNSIGMQALIAATSTSKSPVVRFAALLHQSDQPHDDKALLIKAIKQLCKRYRVPNLYRELAILVASQQQTLMNAHSLTSEEWLQLFNILDIFRREARFTLFLAATKAIARMQHKNLDINFIKGCAKAAKAIDVQKILAQGLSGNNLVYAIQKARLASISAYLRVVG